MRQLLHGAIAMGSFTVGLFFLRFYRDRGDSLFALFGVAFWLLAINNAALATTTASAEMTVLFYVIRLLAFVLIIAGIVVKNRSPS